MKRRIAVINGDGVGAEVIQQSIKVLDAIAEHFNHEFDYTYCLMGDMAIKERNTSLPNETIEVCLNSDAILLGTIASSKYNKEVAEKGSAAKGLLQLRKILGLFAMVRPVTTYPTLHHLSPLKTKVIADVDLVIFRELTAGIYFGEKGTNDAETIASDNCTYTKEAIINIAMLAFKSAQQRRKKITVVDKADVLETSRLWRKTVQEIAHQYPDVAVSFLLADNAVRQILINPKQFDVLLTENLLGDILNNEASVISSSLCMLPAATIGNSSALFSPVHGSYPLIAGKDIANPLGSILSAAMMLDYFNLKEEAQLVRDAVEWTVESLFVSKDLDPINFYFTSTIGELISEYIGGRISGRVNKENIELRKSTII